MAYSEDIRDETLEGAWNAYSLYHHGFPPLANDFGLLTRKSSAGHDTLEVRILLLGEWLDEAAKAAYASLDKKARWQAFNSALYFRHRNDLAPWYANASRQYLKNVKVF